MKVGLKLYLFFLLSILFFSQTAFSSIGPFDDELTLYAYDSFVSKEGLGPKIIPEFEKKFHCRIRALPSGDGGQLFTRVQLDARRGRPSAQVVVGVDQNTWDLIKPYAELWEKWLPQGYSQLHGDVQIEKGFLPVDFGPFALMADREALDEFHLQPPRSLQDLLQPQWKRRVLLEDPRTSTPGLGFLLYSRQILGEGLWDFWKNLQKQWLTLTPSWEGAYGLFLKKEAPLVWSYLTSQAYHDEVSSNPSDKKRYQAVLFEGGQPYQIEGAVMIKGSFKNPKQKLLAQAFLEYLIHPDVQKEIPQRLWMFPSRKNTPLPQSFKRLPQPKLVKMAKSVKIENKAQEISQLLSKWAQVLGK